MREVEQVAVGVVDADVDVEPGVAVDDVVAAAAFEDVAAAAAKDDVAAGERRLMTAQCLVYKTLQA